MRREPEHVLQGLLYRGEPERVLLFRLHRDVEVGVRVADTVRPVEFAEDCNTCHRYRSWGTVRVHLRRGSARLQELPQHVLVAQHARLGQRRAIAANRTPRVWESHQVHLPLGTRILGLQLWKRR